ncbi:Tetratricopeptide TPR_2 repeat protein [Candidatus Ruthia magnifica str. Cm (Calyptogena magnifica)]|uniref:Tetratricopeptide TPR_2 repeat protein n=1 Tax=Ruthia magnifica subsp. Calyptogena magnifica TaxID=413404 RepID=A1AWG4_RUTMC|nr:tetratricopeptide repeat protein [Candidatus Ruthturnera calyptogenae]ABL02271.1 Tetratricopeptide TPR_2 repeat protein [Candidatus Ruthia magnifica str. Cm (Calyptogena magnifica)]
MYYFGLITFLSIFAWQPVSAGINTDKMVMNHNQKIKRLMRKNKSLLGKIELLEQQQKISTGKIKELFNLITYQKFSTTIGKTTLRVREYDQKAKRIYTQARSLLVTDQYDQAIKLFKQYLATYPNNNYTSDVQYWLAKSYLAKDNFYNARNAFVAFQKQNPLHYKFSNSLFELARVYIELNQQDKARSLLNTMLVKFPSHKIINRAKQLLSKIIISKPKINK